MSKQNGNKGRRFDHRAFKEEAVRLLQTGGRRQRQLARLRSWDQRYQARDRPLGRRIASGGFAVPFRKKDAAKEITRRRRERDLSPSGT